MRLREVSQVRLDTYDENEWWDVSRTINPGLTREEFDQIWLEFLQFKRMKELH
jgi:hypothetical protein